MDGHGADHQRHHRVGRNAEREQRNERGLRRRVVGAFRRRHAFDGAAAEALRMLGHPLLERVGGERRDHRAAARQDAEQRADDGAAADGAGRSLQIRQRRHQAGDLGLDDLAALLRLSRLRRISPKPNTPMRDDDEADAVGQFGDAEGHALGAGLEIGADHRQQQADQDHGDRLEHRALGQHHREDQAEHHQREIFRRAEQQREAGQRRAERRDQHGRDAAGEERADGGDRERRAGAALPAIWWPSSAGDDRR